MQKSFRDLEVWRCSMDLAMMVYAVTSEFPKHETYGLTSQMRRAAISIPSNVAEGSARGTRRDFRQFVLTARGSNAELQTQLLIAAGLSYCPQQRIDQALNLCDRVGRMLHGLSTYLKKTTSRPPEPPTTQNSQPTTS